MDLAQIGNEIHRRRVEIGLLQEHGANLAGLSHLTINQLEKGTLKDLGYAKLKEVIEVLGLEIKIIRSPGLKSPLAVAARSISTSYREVISPDMLATVLRSGVVPEHFWPHLMAFLDETTLPVVVEAVAEAATPTVPVKKIMKNLSRWAKQWKVCRTVW